MLRIFLVGDAKLPSIFHSAIFPPQNGPRTAKRTKKSPLLFQKSPSTPNLYGLLEPSLMYTQLHLLKRESVAKNLTLNVKEHVVQIL